MTEASTAAVQAATAEGVKPWSAEMQAKRREQVQTLHRRYAYELYKDSGEFALPRTVDWRGYLWHSLSFLAGDAQHVKRANAMLRYVSDKGGGDFWSSAAVMILCRFGDKLEPDVREHLLRRLREIVPNCARSRFNGYNDNFPAMAALTVLVGAYLIDKPEYVQGGMANLRTLQEMLTRRGFISEYTSPTYSALTLTCLAEIVNYSPNAEAREIALQAEQRVWTELASHFHKETSFLAGPHSRAYMVDMCGHHHNFHLVFYQVFGDALFVNPTTAMFPYREGQVLHGKNPEFMWSHVGWQTAPIYHVPDYAAELALNKQYPYIAEGTSEFGAFPRNWSKPERHPDTPVLEFPAGDTHLYTYMTEDYAVGTASRPFIDSYQNTLYHVVYRRRVPAQALEDITTLFPRYVINDKAPRKDDHMLDEGRPFGIAHESTSMVLYKAKPTWTSDRSVGKEPEPVRSLKLSLIVPCFYAKPDEIWLGAQQASAWQGESAEAVTIFIKDGPVYFALHPLIKTDYGRSVAVRLEEVNGYGMVSLYNYEAPKDGAGSEGRFFSDIELLTCLNGFVAEVGRAQDWPSFAAFREAHSTFTVSDQYQPNTGMREVKYTHNGLSLAMMVSPVSEGIKYRAINGRLVEEPKFRATGFDTSPLPWF